MLQYCGGCGNMSKAENPPDFWRYCCYAEI
uniref:DNA-directed RNA polymerase III subunit n=1 Tax=Podoviridae sp. ct7Kl21 TaxID=2826541 RepID=A0A8S5MD94_9CAUD|nr:MAG TPA: DNA-directed RNA polymerase III subunit [Podoviridae sp. ct7Kl21]